MRLGTSSIIFRLNEICVNETMHVTLVQLSTKVFYVPKVKNQISKIILTVLKIANRKQNGNQLPANNKRYGNFFQQTTW